MGPMLVLIVGVPIVVTNMFVLSCMVVLVRSYGKPYIDIYFRILHAYIYDNILNIH